MPRTEVRWERMFPDELEAAFDRRPIVYLPYGLCEPHGPLNAVGMDALRAHSTSGLAAERHGGIVTPANYWHIHEQGGYGTWAHKRVGDARPWLTALPSWMFLKNMCYHIRAVDALGEEVVNAGGEHHRFIRHPPAAQAVGASSQATWEKVSPSTASNSKLPSREETAESTPRLRRTALIRSTPDTST